MLRRYRPSSLAAFSYVLSCAFVKYGIRSISGCVRLGAGACQPGTRHPGTAVYFGPVPFAPLSSCGSYGFHEWKQRIPAMVGRDGGRLAVAVAEPRGELPAPPGVRPPDGKQQVRRPWQLRNWRVRWRVLALVLVPTVAALTLGGLRVQAASDTSAAAGRTAQLGILGRTSPRWRRPLRTNATSRPAMSRHGRATRARWPRPSTASCRASSGHRRPDLGCPGGPADRPGLPGRRPGDLASALDSLAR